MYLWMLIQNIMHPIPKILAQNSDLYNVHSVCNNIQYKKELGWVGFVLFNDTWSQ